MENTLEYKEMVKDLAKPGLDIIVNISPESMNMLHMAVGVSGEAGELLDAIKKVAIYNKDVDRDNVVEELGDLEFYMEGLRQALNITREETLLANRAKLSKRYPQYKYSDQAAQNRADKSSAHSFTEGSAIE
jgi:NTP pyrophosphatase (non-canonical NTP hydrolase)